MNVRLFKEKKRVWAYIIMLFVLFGANVQQAQAQKKLDQKTTTQKFANLLFLVNNFYVDTVNMEKLTEKAIINTLKELDPHSAYLSKEQIKLDNERLEGSFEGIGVTFQIYEDTLLVVSPIIGGPSDKVGILAGDKIIKIDDEKATGDVLNNKFVFDRLRGKKGTKVDLTIVRDGRKDPIVFTVVRDKIPINSLDAAYLLTNKIGYIKLSRFGRNTVDEYKQAFDSLQNIGMKSLVLDLRGNGGGYLNTAVDLSSQFINANDLVVYTKGVHNDSAALNANSRGNFREGKLVVLINEASASASEIVSGAIQDWDRGLVIGRRSFGKGLVQRPFMLTDRSVVRLTTARYYTPSGRCIQKPYDKGVEEYRKDLLNRVKHGELSNQDSIQFPDSLKFKTNKGRIVYGGGGIMPDIFVPWDSTQYTDLYTDLIRKGIFNKFTVEFLKKERKSSLRRYKDFDTFNKRFSITDKYMDELLSIAEEKKVEIDDKQYELSESLIKKQMKALLARNLYGNSVYFIVINDDDETVDKAIEVIESGKTFKELGINY